MKRFSIPFALICLGISSQAATTAKTASPQKTSPQQEVFLATPCARGQNFGSTVLARPSSSDSRLVVYPYDSNALFTANTTFNKFTHFEFEAGEKIVGSYLNDDSEFEMKVAATGRDIMVRPKVRGANGAMTTITDRRRYQIELIDVSICPGESRYQRVSWTYNDGVYEDRTAISSLSLASPVRTGQSGQPTGIVSGLLPGMPEPQPEPDLNELLRVDLKTLNDNYLIEGDPELTPVAVFDDGNRTLIKFPSAIKLRPVLFALAADGQAEAISYVPVESYFVVNRVFTHGAQLKLGARQVNISTKPCGWLDPACRNRNATQSGNRVGR